jgi:hypothetical protein
MYARIVNNEIAELDAGDFGGVAGWKVVPDADLGKPLKYDTGTSSVRAKTDAEVTTEFNAVLLEDAWSHLRGQRNRYLQKTDEYMSVPDRPATTNMPEYRVYLRDLPATYNDVSILSQDDVMDFEEYVASL